MVQCSWCMCGGRALAQNGAGDLLGHVRDVRGGQGAGTGAAKVRQYLTNEAIAFHCDAADVVGLLCVSEAARGGASRLASSVTVFNELLRRRGPAFAARLFEPQLLDTRGDGGLRFVAVEPAAALPGRPLSTFWHTEYFRTSHALPGAPPLSAEHAELLDAYEAVAGEAGVALDMQLRVGDAQLVNNHVVVHARAAYVDPVAPDAAPAGAGRSDGGGGGGGRHLLRLWLTTEDYSDASPLRLWAARARMALRFLRAKLEGALMSGAL